MVSVAVGVTTVYPNDQVEKKVQFLQQQLLLLQESGVLGLFLLNTFNGELPNIHILLVTLLMHVYDGHHVHAKEKSMQENLKSIAKLVFTHRSQA